MSEMWSWILTAFGLSTMWLAGRKIWWAWFVGIAGQAAWVTYGIVTNQAGFLVGSVACSAIYAKNAIQWTRERLVKNQCAHEHVWQRVGYGGAGWSSYQCECGAEEIDP